MAKKAETQDDLPCILDRCFVIRLKAMGRRMRALFVLGAEGVSLPNLLSQGRDYPTKTPKMRAKGRRNGCSAPTAQRSNKTAALRTSDLRRRQQSPAFWP